MNSIYVEPFELFRHFGYLVTIFFSNYFCSAVSLKDKKDQDGLCDFNISPLSVDLNHCILITQKHAYGTGFFMNIFPPLLLHSGVLLHSCSRVHDVSLFQGC